MKQKPHTKLSDRQKIVKNLPFQGVSKCTGASAKVISEFKAFYQQVALPNNIPKQVSSLNNCHIKTKPDLYKKRSNKDKSCIELQHPCVLEPIAKYEFDTARRKMGTSKPKELTGNYLPLLRKGQSSKTKRSISQTKVSLLKNIVKSVGICSKAGRNSDKSSKHNQDTAFHIPNFNKARNAYIIGVMDGHGDYGTTLSKQVKEILSHNLASILNDILTLKHNSPATKEIRSLLLSNAFEKTQSDIIILNKDDAMESGSTATIILLLDTTLLCANVGDSHAILISFDNNSWTSTQLTTDHRPNIIHEYKRISKSKGEVRPCYGNCK